MKANTDDYTMTCMYCESEFTADNPCWNDDGYTVKEGEDENLPNPTFTGHKNGECAMCAAKRGSYSAQCFVLCLDGKGRIGQ
jgi:hypothetical protein